LAGVALILRTILDAKTAAAHALSEQSFRARSWKAVRSKIQAASGANNPQLPDDSNLEATSNAMQFKVGLRLG
jgi:hypothetical protein